MFFSGPASRRGNISPVMTQWYPSLAFDLQNLWNLRLISSLEASLAEGRFFYTWSNVKEQEILEVEWNEFSIQNPLYWLNEKKYKRIWYLKIESFYLVIQIPFHLLLNAMAQKLENSGQCSFNVWSFNSVFIKMIFAFLRFGSTSFQGQFMSSYTLNFQALFSNWML